MKEKEFLTFAHDLADKATPFLKQGFRAEAARAEMKADRSPVTEVDRAVERQLRDVIISRYPEHGIIGEEWPSYQPEAEYCWILDPIDGTRAFTCGIPTFGMLIALKRSSDILLGVMQQPFTNERWAAEKGGNALYYRDSESTILRTSPCETLQKARFATTSPYLFDDDEKPRFEAIRQATAIQTYGGDCYNYAMLATGHIDLIVEAGLKPYDIAALIPIMEGAGAILTDWEGGPLRLDSPMLNIVASANRALHDEALGVMN